ncbi:serine/arginine repetitive matrix protein 3 [Echinops telfairi]|uniref:Serine/arginine repetitive matrix protein 3 n=1 Tax=Echinops telfairi TaxID=9371 RepID=A0AC55CRB2_ECHTE|nr:serine/arginine repetitive matrix protein 3 [Echinops telfairi]
MSSTVNNGAANMPAPPDASNGFPQPGASSAAWPRAEDELRAAEPGLGKRAHREILDHERKRRVELKCMELQEMMEEQGYSEEEIRQKVGTFRQMLMEKEGVLTREDRPGGHIVAETPRLTEGGESGPECGPFEKDGGPVDCDCPAACYRGPRGYRTKHWSSSSASPPPKKKKKKKGGHRRSRKKRRLDSECSYGSVSPLRKKKRSVRKHRRNRSDSGSQRKRRHRSRSPKGKRKEKNRARKRLHGESPGRRSHRHSSGSSHSPTLSSHCSDSRSPSRLSPRHRDNGRRTGSQRSSGSRSPSPSGGSGWGSPQQNGGSGQRSGAPGGRPGPPHTPSDVPWRDPHGFGKWPLTAAPIGALSKSQIQGEWRQGDPWPLLERPRAWGPQDRQSSEPCTPAELTLSSWQCPQAPHPLLPAKPLLLLQLPEQRLLQPEPQPRKLQQPEPRDPQSHTQPLPDPQSQLPQPEQLREWGLLSQTHPAWGPLSLGEARGQAPGPWGALHPHGYQEGPGASTWADGTEEGLEGKCLTARDELDSGASRGCPPPSLAHRLGPGNKEPMQTQGLLWLEASSPG